MSSRGLSGKEMLMSTKPNPMSASPGTRYRLKGAQHLESFARSPHVADACRGTQQRFDDAMGATAPVVVESFVRGFCHVAIWDSADFFDADFQVRALKAVLQCKIEERADMVTEVAALLGPVARLSNRVCPDKPGLRIWLHGPVERRPDYLHYQAKDVAGWIESQAENLVPPMVPGVTFAPGDLAAAIHVPAAKLGEVLGSIDEIRLRLTSALIRRRKTMAKARESYLSVRSILDGVCRLGGQAIAFDKYGLPSLRQLERGGRVAKNLPLAVSQSDTPAESRSKTVSESDLPTETCSKTTPESDLPNKSRSKTAPESDFPDESRSHRVCESKSSVTSRARRSKRRDLSVTSDPTRHRRQLSSVTSGVQGPGEGRLSVTNVLRSPRGRDLSVTRRLRSSENRGNGPKPGVTARILSFLTRPLRS
jgi:hypothetical protein